MFALPSFESLFPQMDCEHTARTIVLRNPIIPHWLAICCAYHIEALYGVNLNESVNHVFEQRPRDTAFTADIAHWLEGSSAKNRLF